MMRWLHTLLDAALHRRVRKSAAPVGGWQPQQVACWDCGLTHRLPLNIAQALRSAEDFFARHAGHQVNWFEQPGLAGLWTPNADVKVAYAASAAYTITLTGLVTSSTLIAGRQSTPISNTANLYHDYLVGGRITSGTTPTVDKSIEIWLFGSVNDTPTYPDQFSTADADRSVTSVNIKKSAVRILDRLFVDATTDRVNWFGPVGIAQAFGWVLPKNHGVWVVHDCVAALHTTPGNHVVSHTGVFHTVI